jgi:Tfp pilus assembly protein PilO
MRIFGIRISEWSWVLYPVIVVVIMVVGVNFWFSGGVESLDTMFIKPTKIAQEQKEVALLRTRSEQLKSVNKDEVMEKLQKMLIAEPASKKVWLLLAELQASASTSGVLIENYRANVGDVKEASEAAKPVSDVPGGDVLSLKVEYRLHDFSELIKLLGILQKMLPLVRVVSVEYDTAGLRLGVESAWAGWQRVDAGGTGVLPEYAAGVEKALKSTTDFTTVGSW